jgi:hypothetical protein
VVEQSSLQQAYMPGTNDMFWLWGWILLALIAVTWIAQPPLMAARTVAVAD